MPPSEFQAFGVFSACFKSKGQIPFAWFLQILPLSTEVGPFQTETLAQNSITSWSLTLKPGIPLPHLGDGVLNEKVQCYVVAVIVSGGKGGKVLM